MSEEAKQKDDKEAEQHLYTFLQTRSYMHSLAEDQSHMVQVRKGRLFVMHSFHLTKNYSLYQTDESQRVELLPGDHALIPAFVEHQEVSQVCAYTRQ